jgi:hypothetical protein
MGLRSLPFQWVQAMGIAKEVIQGDPTDFKNVFWWDLVELNLPGSEGYDRSRPWVAKYPWKTVALLRIYSSLWTTFALPVLVVKMLGWPLERLPAP